MDRFFSHVTRKSPIEANVKMPLHSQTIFSNMRKEGRKLGELVYNKVCNYCFYVATAKIHFKNGTSKARHLKFQTLTAN